MMIPGQLITAVDMAIASGIDPKRFRAALRAAGLGWHPHNGRWEVVSGSDQHHDMERVMARLGGEAPTSGQRQRRRKTFPGQQSATSTMCSISATRFSD